VAKLVPDEGSNRARLVLIGEAPGAQEEEQGRPFVGPSGWKLDRWWRQVGLQRADFYITNVVPYRPKQNKIENVPQEELDEHIRALHARLGELQDPWLIVATGNTAVSGLLNRSGITRHRGSIYEYRDQRDRRIKVIPTLHPAFVLRDPSEERSALADWRRIAEDSTFRELRLPEREHLIQPTLDDVRWFLEEARKHAEAMAIDIETPGGEIACIGFSFDPGFSLTIPTTLHYWESLEALEQAERMVRELCTLPCEKVLQNGLFDTFYLAEAGIEVANWRWDTLAMHHALDASAPHSLAWQASVFTREPYWKSDSKDSKDAKSHRIKDWETYWRYNGKDACVTREIAEGHYERLIEAGKLDFYLKHYQALFAPCLRMMLHGIRVDVAQRKEQYERLMRDCQRLRAELEEMAGEPLHAKKDLSSTRIQKFLYKTLKLPAQRSRKTGNVTANEVTLRSLRLKHPDVAGPAIDRILEHRRKFKLAGFMSGTQMDPDQHVRCQLKFTTDTGRLSSSKSPRGTGMNLFNIDREARSIFVPEPGHILLELDASQLESRIVYLLTGDPELIEKAYSKPWEYDDHTYHASIVMAKAPEDVLKFPDRYLGKKCNHAYNYDMHARKLSEVVLNETEGALVLTPEEAQVYLSRLDTVKAGPVKGWHRRTRKEIIQRRKLTNSWGRELSFEFARLDDETYRQAYAFRPQSDGADLVKDALIRLDAWMTERFDQREAAILVSVYDSILVTCRPELAWEIYQKGKEFLEIPHNYYGHVLSIPAEGSVGLSWGEKKEWKRPPNREAFEAVIKELG